MTVGYLAPVVFCALSRSEGQQSVPSGGEEIHSFTELLMKWHFVLKGMGEIRRTTPFPSAMCPWASVSSHQKSLYLPSLSLCTSNRTPCFPPSIKAATGDAQNY